ncbi:MAG: preprotein translocase subunit SecG [Candidatus Eremiobacteraeota bacterium]|nr:preprotein translocase subunit SecG [Candidatus Eremiobacteraeota bacterium]
MFLHNLLYLAQEGDVPAIPAPPGSAGIPEAVTTTGGGGGAFSVLLAIIYILVCITLIGLVLVQTTKSEGLSGIIGGASQSIFRGKKSFEEKLNTYTTYIAWGFLILSIFVSFLIFKS